MNRTKEPHSASLSSPRLLSQPQTEPTLRIRSKRHRDGNLLINLSTGTRLTLSFLVAAFIAALVVGAIGIQRSQSLTNQSRFYQNLLQANTSLTTGAQYLQLMRAETQSILTQITSTQTSQETLNSEQNALVNLSKRYNDTLTSYITNDQLTKRPDETALLLEANHEAQINQQGTLSSSALRTWRVYQASVTQALAFIKKAQIAEALHLEQFQVEPTNADALSALRALIQFDSKLALSVQDAANVEQQSQFITTIISSIIAFIAILLIGWIISGTIVRRLNLLREVTQAVEQGQLNRRVIVVGRDEIADVSASVNGMLEAIVGLLEETRHQRDALTNAAEHLFTDMRVVSSGDLRVNAPVSNDPIGMLANAFNFTVGRFRRFVQRTRTIAEQIDVIAQQEIERAGKFTQAAMTIKTGQTGNLVNPSSQTNTHTLSRGGIPPHYLQAEEDDKHIKEIVSHIQDIQVHLKQSSQDGIIQQRRRVTNLTGQLSTAIEHLNRLTGALTPSGIRQEELRKRMLGEIRILENQLKSMMIESQNAEREIFKDFQEMDNEMSQISIALRAQKSKKISDTMATKTEYEAPSELMQLSAALANDIITIGRQLNALAQEIRTGIVSFQLDSIEGNNNQPNGPTTLSQGIDPNSNIQFPRSVHLSGERNR